KPTESSRPAPELQTGSAMDNFPFRDKNNETGIEILVAEDDPMNMLLISEVLKTLGLHVIKACNGEEAVACLNEHHPALVFMDINMPEMDGYEATRTIRQLPGSQSNIPIIALTASVMKEDRNRCVQAGMNHLISKPFELKEIRDILKHYALVA
ncbi:MAG: response regulator, partial [Bacteroidota bacterium]|nr:response regulator [Bacteroidota bacterium]